MPQEVSQGEIKYQAPDKAVYKDTQTQIYQPPKKAGDKATWPTAPAGAGHHWVCDGASIYEFDAANSQVLKTILPPQLRGQALVTQGPLPFLFRAKAQEIQRRYWIHLASQNEKHFVLEAHPKYQRDAADYQKIDVYIDRQQFLPEFLVVYNTNYEPRRNPARISYKFSDRQINPLQKQKRNPLDLLNLRKRWAGDFIEPKVPRGWKTVEKHIPAANLAPPQAARPLLPQSAAQARAPSAPQR